MRWAFWRQDRPAAGAADPLATSSWPPPLVAPAAPAAPRPEQGDDQDRPAPSAFSGASPRPGEHGDDLEPPPDVDFDADVDGDGDVDVPAEGLDLDGVRGDVLALVRAVADRDREAAEQALHRLDEADALSVAVLAAMAVLGERLVDAAGHALDAGPEAVPEVLAQGGTVARRADRLLRAVVPDARPDVVALVVQCGAGVLEQDPAVGQLVDQPLEQLLLVAAALLAQTVADGQGTLPDLADELAELLPS